MFDLFFVRLGVGFFHGLAYFAWQERFSSLPVKTAQ